MCNLLDTLSKLIRFWRYLIPNLETAERVLDAVDSEHVGLQLDIYHLQKTEQYNTHIALMHEVLRVLPRTLHVQVLA